ncbi:invasion associated locus B family protein [Shinella yambaruensis]|uniref:Invasion associated locus B family protein n=1 Tax=Shinella yambaruensis TaxID=415996 RepID=A0ABQ5ZNL4_9HYPH|nr:MULTISPECIES: invasion associated locus B family protein [Shinella]CAI0337669.1 Invasion associated locus B family protein [Rhizobiaceae bacterium]CAK7256147.1 Invasion associated locus B family protein [Shinella sp. WSC3-e]MCJ8024010.1 invasion associated locus B family protein [Shinella yambaruensis]MCO5140360.1 invasion associated locus B family protein [Shinella sp.]MCU7978840.1 invasion associated locus B family protein [Shinella yambaruensis]
MIFTSHLIKRTVLSAFAASVALAAAPSASLAQQQAAPPKGWFKVCTKQEDNDVCIVQNLLTANSGQLITAVGLITVAGKTNRKIMQVSVPSARLIPPGVQMQIDGGKAQKLDYAICMPDKCVAEVPLTDQMISSLKKGGELVLTSVNFQRAPNPIKISLEGFTGVFDGEPIEQSQLEERQRLLQEEMQKKAEEARKKLEEAQKAAKSQ